MAGLTPTKPKLAVVNLDKISKQDQQLTESLQQVQRFINVSLPTPAGNRRPAPPLRLVNPARKV